MMETARTYETSVDDYFTRQYILEDSSELHTRRRENLKSHVTIKCLFLHNSVHTASLKDVRESLYRALPSKTQVKLALICTVQYFHRRS
jgi:hypothetical protein